MSVRHKSLALLQRDEIVDAPRLRACNDRTFELPPILHILTAAMFLGFVTVLSLAFSGDMLVSYGVFVAFIVAFFTVPALWVRTKRDENRSAALGWNEFMEKGIATATGRASGPETTVLVLLLPFVILCWAIAVVAIASLI